MQNNINLKCKKCGHENIKQALECSHCGQKDPADEMAKELESKKEYYSNDKSKWDKKMSGEIPLDS